MEYTVNWISLVNIEKIKKYLEVRNTFPDTILGIRRCGKEVYLAAYDLGIYIPDSPEYKEVNQACWEIAHGWDDSYKIDVPKMRVQEVKVMEIVETILNLPEKIEDVFNS